MVHYHTGISHYKIKPLRDTNGHQQYSRLLDIYNAQLVLRGSKCAKKTFSTLLHHQQSPQLTEALGDLDDFMYLGDFQHLDDFMYCSAAP